MKKWIKTLEDIADQLELDGAKTDSPAFLRLQELAIEEKEIIAAPTYNELPDHELAKVVRKISLRLSKKTITGFEGVSTMAASIILINAAMECNAGEIKFDLNNYTSNGEPKGNWEIVVRQKKVKEAKAGK